MADEILVSVADGIATVTMNRPAQRNAMNRALLDGMRKSFDDLDARRDVRVVVVRGAGPAFCAGMDLKEMEARGGVADPEASVIEVLQRVESSAQPTRMTAATSKSANTPSGSTSQEATLLPRAAPSDAPSATSANRRRPCSSVKRSFANDQSCATTIMLKMPIQTKKTRPRLRRRGGKRLARKKSTRCDAKNSVTETTSRSRGSLST